jgi:hypothetical protein
MPLGGQSREDVFQVTCSYAPACEMLMRCLEDRLGKKISEDVFEGQSALYTALPSPQHLFRNQSDQQGPCRSVFLRLISPRVILTLMTCSDRV